MDDAYAAMDYVRTNAEWVKAQAAYEAAVKAHTDKQTAITDLDAKMVINATELTAATTAKTTAETAATAAGFDENKQYVDTWSNYCADGDTACITARDALTTELAAAKTAAEGAKATVGVDGAAYDPLAFAAAAAGGSDGSGSDGSGSFAIAGQPGSSPT